MSLDRIEKLLKAHEGHTERTNRELLLELRKMQEEIDYMRKLNKFEALKRDAVFDNTDQAIWEVRPAGEQLKKRKGWYTPVECTASTAASIPHDIAPAQIIERILIGADCSSRSERSRADQCDWYKGSLYKITTDNKGIPYCADVDLEPWAEYVATDMDGIVHQYAATPEWCADDRMWNNTRGGWKKIPEYSARFYRKNVPASESLMRVWRES